MGGVKKIEDRTTWFIREYKRLTDAGKMPSNTELAKILNIKSKSSISNILAGTHNIQPESWNLFKKHFGIEYATNSHFVERPVQKEPSPMELLGGLMEGFKAIAETMKGIQNQMAREDTQAIINKKVTEIDSNLTETLAGVEFVSKIRLQQVLDAIQNLKAENNTPSPDERKRPRESGGDGHKQGIKT